MPVYGADARLVGALAISAPAARLTPDRVRIIGAMLSEAAWDLTNALGGAGEAAGKDAVASGAASLWVVGNPHAQGFYEACGFKVIEECETRFGQGLVMRRDLPKLGLLD